MHITTVDTENFKGGTRRLELARRTVLTGENSSGKTTALHAIQVALMGYEPNAGPKGVRELMSAAETRVSVTLDDDDGRTFGVTRRYQVDEQDALKASASCLPSLGEKTNKAIADRVTATVGDAVVMLNPREFTTLTPGKRAESLGRMLGANAKSTGVQDFLALLETAATADGVTLAPELAKLIRDVWQPAAGIAANLANARKVIGTQLAAVAAEEERATAALQSLTQQRNVLDPEPMSAAALGAERDAQRKIATGFREQLAASAARAEAFTRAQADATAAEVALTAARAKVVTTEAALKTAEAAHAAAMEAVRAAEQVETPPEIPAAVVTPEDSGLLEVAQEGDELALRCDTEADLIAVPPKIDAEAERKVVAQAAAELAQARKSPWREVEALANLIDAKELNYPTPPRCSDETNSLRALAVENGKDAEAMVTRLDEARHALTQRENEVAANDVAIGDATARRTKARALAAQSRAVASDARKDAAQRAKEKNVDAAFARATAVSARSAILTANAAKLETAKTAARKTHTTAQAARTEHTAATTAVDGAIDRARATQATLNTAPGSIDIAATMAAATAADTEVTRLDGAIAAKERARAATDQALRAEQQARDLQTKAKDLRKLRKVATGIVAETLAKTFAPMTKTATEVLAGINPRWAIEAIAEEDGIDLAGRTGSGEPVRWRQLAGGETLMFCAGLAVALVRLLNAPVKILLLDAAEVDRKNLPLLLDALTKMAPDFDSIIVASCHADAAELPAEWKVIELTAEATATTARTVGAA